MPQLTTVAGNITRLNLPERGSFNAGLAQMPDSDEYLMAYRPNEHSFIACRLRSDLTPIPKSYFRFSMGNCADPRLIWLPDKRLLMVYSSTEEVGMARECIRGAIVMDRNRSENFVDGPAFRISPEGPWRHKNWTPFIHDGAIYLIATIGPHIVYRLQLDGETAECQQVYETPWISPWPWPEFFRGNTPPVRLDDGNYLSTFHTATWYDGCCYYDNGVYLFEGKPPFKVLKCGNRTFLPAEAAVEPPFRKAGIIRCIFPVGMVRSSERILISYGDSDSCVKILDTRVSELLTTMVDIY